MLEVFPTYMDTSA